MHLSSGISGLCLWEETKSKDYYEKTDSSVRDGAGDKQQSQKREAESIRAYLRTVSFRNGVEHGNVSE